MPSLVSLTHFSAAFSIYPLDAHYPPDAHYPLAASLAALRHHGAAAAHSGTRRQVAGFLTKDCT